MQINRDVLLKCLDAVSAGLSKADIVEQSSCFVFMNQRVMTFNDEVACSVAAPFELQGAIPAEPLRALLQKLQEQTVDIQQRDGELLVKGKGKRAGIRCESQVLLPIQNIEDPGEWKELPEDFTEAIESVIESAGRNDSEFIFTCLHLTPSFIEASDNYQMARYKIKTGLSKSILVRADALKGVIGLDMTEFSETPSWIHFRNPAGLVYSARRHSIQYVNLDELIKSQGTPTTLPAGLSEAVEKAEIFSSNDIQANHVTITLKPGTLLLEGRGVSGWYQEKRQVKYDGAEMRFIISPKLLIDIVSRTTDCQIAEGRLVIRANKFVYVGCLSQAKG